MPRRRPGTLLPLEVRILESGIALQRAEGSFYGFGIARELVSGDDASLTAHGTLYKALNRMASAGLLDAEWEDAQIAEDHNRPRRRLYRVTGEGARVLAAQARSVTQASASAARIGLA